MKNYGNLGGCYPLRIRCYPPAFDMNCRKIPKISPSMFKPLQCNPPKLVEQKQPSVKSPLRGLVLEKLPSNTKKNKAITVQQLKNFCTCQITIACGK